MSEFKVFLNGLITINADCELEALKIVEKNYLQHTLQELNLDIVGVRKMEVENDTTTNA